MIETEKRTTRPRRWLTRGVVAGTLAVGAPLAVTAGPATSALADPASGTLTVTIHCGCVLFDNEAGFPAGITGGLPVGQAPYTPAADNHGAATFTP